MRYTAHLFCMKYFESAILIGVIPSFSRPSVSNDNPFSESLFKTIKYCPIFTDKPFASIDEAKKDEKFCTLVQQYSFT